MADMAPGINWNASLARRTSEARTTAGVHPAWQRLIRYCAELGHGELDKLKIHDGLPVAADIVREKVKFT
jgi:hypothetical protein